MNFYVTISVFSCCFVKTMMLDAYALQVHFPRKCMPDYYFLHFSQVLFTRDTLLAYSGVYYLGTIVPVVIIILGAVFPAKKSSRGAKKGRREGGKALVEEQNGEKVVKKEF